jgi:hypothetical protein
MPSVGSDKNTRELEMVGIQLPEKSASKTSTFQAKALRRHLVRDWGSLLRRGFSFLRAFHYTLHGGSRKIRAPSPSGYARVPRSVHVSAVKCPKKTKASAEERGTRELRSCRRTTDYV